ncbi:DUF2798 domain-containing protein [uncultured Moraxella sp.]|uniref:DUF2798 domain-containing protein n=1 Tax=uncultured Moraxella sp. TaxID=263769 RepID=UPI0025D80119|nr:DUF2798 domain-containing protein [uncultured Moraxella sp.]
MKSKQNFAFIPARFAHIAFAFYMASIMAFLMSIILVWINTGFDAGFMTRVLHSYVISVPIAGCCVIMVRPLVQKLINITVKSEDPP